MNRLWILQVKRIAVPSHLTPEFGIQSLDRGGVGRDLGEITCSVQIALPPDQAPDESVAQAAALAEQGADVVIFSLRTPYRVETVEPLARALEQLV